MIRALSLLVPQKALTQPPVFFKTHILVKTVRLDQHELFWRFKGKGVLTNFINREPL